jgi:hypothetical protein
MKHTKIYLALAAIASTFAFSSLEGCGSSGTGTGGAGGSTTSATSTTDTATSTGTTTSATSTGTGTSTASGTGGGPMIPKPPALGEQLDRFGRPAINTALNHTFDTDVAKKGMAKDAYNVDKNVAMWGPTYGAEFAGNLAILDSLDTICGNQLLAGPNPVAGQYDKLAGALADDRVWVNLDGAACTTYLAVEANATGLNPNMDCGGRKLDYDPIDISYSALAIGKLAGVGDGVDADADTKGTMFPYLANPH